MGADIHCYIEHARPKREDYWRAFGGRINPGRDYTMFAILAGVRGSEQPLIPPRGLPPHLGWESNRDSHLFVSKDNPGGEGNCSREQAVKWVAQGSATWQGEAQNFVTHPDWHSHSWMTPDEWEAACAAGEKANPAFPVDPEYYAMLAAMRELEKRGLVVRVVFWFDN